MSGSPHPSETFRARILEGRALAEGGDYAGAEALFREALEDVRGQHEGNHALALQSLITLYGRGGRYLEAHMLARRLAERARELGPEADRIQAFALGAICGALSQLDLTEPLGRALVDLRSVLDRFESPLVGLELEYRAAAVVHARHVEAYDLAREHVAVYRRTIEENDGLEDVFRWALIMTQAQLAHHEGNHRLAAHLAGQLGTTLDTPPFHRLKELALLVSVHAALGEREELRPLAEEALGILDAVRSEAGLASGRIHEGAVLAADLERVGELEMAHRVYDYVAAAVMIRIRQLDECLRDLPELGIDDPESTAVLTRFRKQFVREQRALLQRVARVLASRGDGYVLSLLERSAPSGFVAICAWCESVRPTDGRWLPIGHFVPRDGSFQVTHAICPPCAEAMG